VTLIQALASGALQVPWQQGLVILAVIWFSAICRSCGTGVTQNHVNIQYVFYARGSLLVMAAHLWTTFGNYRRRPWLAGSGRSQWLCRPAARLAC
jgi:hypothetical protein